MKNKSYQVPETELIQFTPEGCLCQSFGSSTEDLQNPEDMDWGD